MPVVKGGVWTNIEDEILKASVSKYGLNQWARVSSLLARKTPKQCKARWFEWLDPGIRKVEFSKEEDEKLLHLAKLMPTQWRTIAPIVGRTATQCLERYQKLLDEAEARENDELGLGGPAGGETAAPSADDVRKLRPGELDPDPESKPARPDTIDLDEDEKEMLSEARARLANTQGKKAKRKARERQLEESRRLALLQKRRELKTAGINIKVTTRKKGQMDYNADIPFEKAPAPGFFDTRDEEGRNEREREMFDPRKQQLAIKRKGDQDDDADAGEDRKRRKNDKTGQLAASAAAARAGQMQKVREAEQQSKRRSLALPAPQVGEQELEDIVKMGMAGERAGRMARDGSENEATRGFVGDYARTLVDATPIRTPRAPQEEDRIANEIRNARARTETQSALLGGDNTPLHEDGASTGFGGATPAPSQIVTPNPMATPFRQGGAAAGATPMRAGPGATPMRTPRDTFNLNADGGGQLVGQTPREVRLAEKAARETLRGQLAALPKPKETEWEFELPDELPEAGAGDDRVEDAAERDRRNLEARRAAERAEFARQSQVLQRALPRPARVDVAAMLRRAGDAGDPVAAAVAREVALLVASDAAKSGGRVEGGARPLDVFSDDLRARAKMEIALELSVDGTAAGIEAIGRAWEEYRDEVRLPGLDGYDDDDGERGQAVMDDFNTLNDAIVSSATAAAKVEQKLQPQLRGFQNRAKTLRAKMDEAAEALERATIEYDSARTMQVGEEAAAQRRLEALREEVAFVMRREREAQELYRGRRDELQLLAEEGATGINGVR